MTHVEWLINCPRLRLRDGFFVVSFLNGVDNKNAVKRSIFDINRAVQIWGLIFFYNVSPIGREKVILKWELRTKIKYIVTSLLKKRIKWFFFWRGWISFYTLPKASLKSVKSLLTASSFSLLIFFHSYINMHNKKIKEKFIKYK